MARITVEDCLKKIDSQYDLVLLAKERTAQLNAGDKSLVPEDNDKNTVIALREIGEGKISIKNVEDSAINKMRKTRNEPKELEDLEVDSDDEFDKIYKGEISKSGAAILPSKRVRRLPEKIFSDEKEETQESKQVTQVSKEETQESKEEIREDEEQELSNPEKVDKATE
jgi:DNA-directed RNA polymerase subunit omega